MAVTERRIYHPLQRDYVTFLQTAEETGGEYLLIEVELAPHGGNPLHRHLAFTETFEGVEGELYVHRAGQELVLGPGEKAVVPPGTVHRFYSEADRPIRFRVEHRPPLQWEQVLRIGYGLAMDGKVTSKGVPKNFLQAALLFTMSDTYLVGPPVGLQRTIFRPLAALARWRGVDRKLTKYL
jgi:quercetin dioxygenase-like cupin family protein